MAPPPHTESSGSNPSIDVISPLLSVIIPAFHARETISETLESLRTSSKLLEVIVVENGSSELDPTSLQDHLGLAALHYIRLVTADLSSARNRGFSEAKGEFVQFLDADDLVHIDAILRTLASSLSDDLSVLVLGRRDVKNIPQSWPHPSPSQKQRGVEVMPGSLFLLRALAAGRYSPVTGTYIFRRQALLDMEILFAEGFYHEDHAVVAGILTQSDVVGRTHFVGFLKRSRAFSLSKLFPVEVTVNGYTRAQDDLRQTGKKLARNSFFSRFALGWIVWRIDAIVSLKQFRALAETSNRRIDAAIRLLTSAMKYVVVSLAGRVVLVMACMANRYRRLRVPETQTNRVASIRG